MGRYKLICVECGRRGRMHMTAYGQGDMPGSKKVIGGICKKCVRKGIGRQHLMDTKQTHLGYLEGFRRFMDQVKAKAIAQEKRINL